MLEVVRTLEPFTELNKESASGIIPRLPKQCANELAEINAANGA
jgi:hypothetical protein